MYVFNIPSVIGGGFFLDKQVSELQPSLPSGCFSTPLSSSCLCLHQPSQIEKFHRRRFISFPVFDHCGKLLFGGLCRISSVAEDNPPSQPLLLPLDPVRREDRIRSGAVEHQVLGQRRSNPANR